MAATPMKTVFMAFSCYIFRMMEGIYKEFVAVGWGRSMPTVPAHNSEVTL